MFFLLPVTLVLYHGVAGLMRAGGCTGAATARTLNALVLAASVVFYAWGEPMLVFVMLGSTVANYLFGRAMAAVPPGPDGVVRRSGTRRVLVTLAVIFNVVLLAVFKYYHFGLDSVNAVLGGMGFEPLQSPWTIALPLGISFYTFQLMSYAIDVYRGDAPPCRDFISFAAYITMFPQLVAGPIIRYADIQPRLFERSLELDDFAKGVRRFVLGLGKKLLVANVVSVPVDAIYALGPDQVSAPLAWLAALGYYVQLYYDFSGYSDMAIGMGWMLGFHFMENFNYPYLSKSFSEFWRRWHISLSTWIRDYLFIPLGGSRRGRGRVLFNLFLVYLFCGLWHGASWTYVVWGLINGAFMMAEREGWEAFCERRFPRVVRIAAMQLVFILTLVLFRSESFALTGRFLRLMFGFFPAGTAAPRLDCFLTRDVMLAMAAGLVLSYPVVPFLGAKLRSALERIPDGARRLRPALYALDYAGLALILLACSMQLAAGTHNPFLYFRF